jgi:hypothetical protein
MLRSSARHYSSQRDEFYLTIERKNCFGGQLPPKQFSERIAALS